MKSELLKPKKTKCKNIFFIFCITKIQILFYDIIDGTYLYKYKKYI